MYMKTKRTEIYNTVMFLQIKLFTSRHVAYPNKKLESFLLVNWGNTSNIPIIDG